MNELSNLTITDVQFLPIIKEYARIINLVDTINHLVDTEMELQPALLYLQWFWIHCPVDIRYID